MGNRKDIRVEIPDPRRVAEGDILAIAIDVLTEDISQHFGSPGDNSRDHARSLASSYFYKDDLARERAPELFEGDEDLMHVVHDELTRIAAQEGLNSAVGGDRERITQLFRESPLYQSLRKVANLSGLE